MFRGHEPDEKRWGVEMLKFYSWSVRNLDFHTIMDVASEHRTNQIVRGRHLQDDEQRTTANVQYANRQGLSAIAAVSNKDIIGEDEDSDARLAEVNWNIGAPHHVRVVRKYAQTRAIPR